MREKSSAACANFEVPGEWIHLHLGKWDFFRAFEATGESNPSLSFDLHRPDQCRHLEKKVNIAAQVVGREHISDLGPPVWRFLCLSILVFSVFFGAQMAVHLQYWHGSLKKNEYSARRSVFKAECSARNTWFLSRVFG